MTSLQKKALGRVALTKETVESFYDGTRSGTPEQCLKALCESHERLRSELEGAEILLEEQQDEAAKDRQAPSGERMTPRADAFQKAIEMALTNAYRRGREDGAAEAQR